MKQTIAEILQDPNFNSNIKVSGWVRTRRGGKNVSFIALNDGSTIKNLQIVAEASCFNEDLIKNITTGACLEIHGKIKKSEGKEQKLELLASKIVILGKVGDNFGAGMTGGMAFIHDPKNIFENYANPTSIVWLKPETKYWKNKLKKLLEEYTLETESEVSKNILASFSKEVENFKQVCPIEMLDKLENPISLKTKISKAI